MMEISILVLLVVTSFHLICDGEFTNTGSFRYINHSIGLGIAAPRNQITHERSLLKCTELCMQDNNCKIFATNEMESGKVKCSFEVNLNYLPIVAWKVYASGCYLVKPVNRFVRRQDGSVDFSRNWGNYKTGFGNSDGEFWLGLDELHAITTTGSYGLLVEVEDWNGDQFCSIYTSFAVGAEADRYRLSISGYQTAASTAGNSMDYVGQAGLDGMQFSTMDQDNDVWSGDCSNTYGGSGGWWYKDCSLGDATGIYYHGDGENVQGISWYYLHNNHQSFKTMTMSLWVI